MNKRQKQLAQIHIAKRDLGLDEDTYRDLLESETGKRSAADMNEAELEAVIMRMRNCGWQAYPRRPGNMEVPGKARLKKTEALLADMMLPWAYADTIAQRKFGVRLCQWCTSEQLGGIIKELERRHVSVKNYLISLKSVKCACGGKKKTRQAFCIKCYRSLSPGARKNLYKPVRQGYEAAYDDALAELQQGGVI